MRRLINFTLRCAVALRYMRVLKYSAHLAWVKSAR